MVDSHEVKRRMIAAAANDPATFVRDVLLTGEPTAFASPEDGTYEEFRQELATVLDVAGCLASGSRALPVHFGIPDG